MCECDTIKISFHYLFSIETDTKLTRSLSYHEFFEAFYRCLNWLLRAENVFAISIQCGASAKEQRKKCVFKWCAMEMEMFWLRWENDVRSLHKLHIKTNHFCLDKYTKCQS